MPSKDINKLRRAQRTYKVKHREEINARKRAAYKADTQKHLARSSAYRRENKDKVNLYNKKYGIILRARLRTEMLAAYGGRCKCCGESEPKFLQLDHIENDGAKDRKAFRTTAKMWAWLRDAGWPKERHQLLCANCNFGKLMNGGICPHKTRPTNDQS